MAKQATYQTQAGAKATPPKKAVERDPVAAGTRDAAYNLMDRFEAGVALRGAEVKSIREGKAQLKDSYGLVKNGEAWLLNAHIGAYSHTGFDVPDATRTRKLLLHTGEIRKLVDQTQAKGLTLIPTRLYFRNGRVKCELAVAKGKQEYDKRATERQREGDREARAAVLTGRG